MTNNFSRRDFLKSAIHCAGYAAASKLIIPGIAFAQARTEYRFVTIILRGGMDGLAALVPFGDPAYQTLRQGLSLDPDQLLRVNDFYGFHSSFENMHDMFLKRELSVVNAVATPYRERSHFDGQNVLELGSSAPHALEDGWMNRLARAINNKDQDLALAVGQTVPLILRGNHPAASWAPSVMPEAGATYMQILDKLYDGYPMFNKAFDEARMIEEKADMLMDHDDKDMQSMQQMARQSRSPQAFLTMADMAGRFLSEKDGPRLATLELGGWDTHARQGTEAGTLANNFTLLDQGLANLKDALGTQAWKKTVVVALTEFGRTAKPNGTGGTDHGTASLMILAGGAVKGGQVIGAWPGLSDKNLYQNRDLMPTTDLRAVMKGILNDLYGLSPSVLSHDIYPGSASVKSISGLLL